MLYSRTVGNPRHFISEFDCRKGTRIGPHGDISIPSDQSGQRFCPHLLTISIAHNFGFASAITGKQPAAGVYSASRSSCFVSTLSFTMSFVNPNERNYRFPGEGKPPLREPPSNDEIHPNAGKVRSFLLRGSVALNFSRFLSRHNSRITVVIW